MTTVNVGDEVRTIGGARFFKKIPLGTRGKIIGFLEMQGLFKVRMKDETVYYLRAEELELVPRIELIQELRDSLAKQGLPEKLLGRIDTWLKEEIEKEKEEPSDRPSPQLPQ